MDLTALAAVASYPYLVLMFVVFAVSLVRPSPSFACSVVLLIWVALVQIAYEQDVVESTSTVIIACVFLVACGWLVRRYHHWLPWCLVSMGTAMLVWSAYYMTYGDDDAYHYKEVKNVIWLTLGILPIILSWWSHPKWILTGTR